MDQARFLEACRWACSGKAVRQGIGTLGEKTLHSAVKYYFQPDPSQREVRLGRYVADALTSQGVTEVQTRAFDRLRPKLCAFLGQGPVTLVYPVPAKKTVAWISETGEITPPPQKPSQARCRLCASRAVQAWGAAFPSQPPAVCFAAGGGGVPSAKRLEP